MWRQALHSQFAYPRNRHSRYARGECPTSEILVDFPDLEAEDIQAALVFAAQRASHARLVA